MRIEGFREATLPGGYTILNEAPLGRGGFGVVYRARYAQDNSLVAAKILVDRQGGEPDAEMQADFHREAQLNAHLHHPRIVPLYWHGVAQFPGPNHSSRSENYPFLILAYADQGSLATVLAQQPLLPIEQAVAYLSQAADGLQYAHDRRVLHRDIKPPNLLLHTPHPTAQQPDVWVADFGIAVTAHGINTPRQITPQLGAGTPAYMAADQFEGQAVKESDIYSLGVVAYQLLTGTLPFNEANFAEYYIAHKQKIPLSFAEARRGRGFVPNTMVDALEGAVRKALEKDPQARYHAMADFAQALQEGYTKARERERLQSRFFLPPTVARQPDSFYTATTSLQDMPIQPAQPIIQKARPEKKLPRGVVPKKEALPVRFDELAALADYLKQQEQYTALLQVSEQIIALYPNNTHGWALKGLSLCRFGKYEETLEPYERAIQLDPTNYEAMRNKADSLNKLGRHAEALPLLERTLQLNPTYVEAWGDKGDALYDLGRYKEAIAAYDQAIKLDPTGSYAYLKKGNTLHTLERFEEAIAAYDQALRINPIDSSDAYNNKGNALSDLGRYEEALQAYEQFLRLDQTVSVAYVNKGNTLVTLGRYEEALQAYDQALRLDPTDSLAYLNKGMALCELGQYQQASDCFRQALANNPSKETKQAIKQAKKQYHIR